MGKLSKLKKHRRQFLKEDLPVANNTNTTTNQEESTTQNQTTDQGTVLNDPNKPLFTKEDVAKMTPGEIINYVYVSMPPNIDPQTKEALMARADELRRDAETGKDVKSRARQILRSIGSNIDIGL